MAMETNDPKIITIEYFVPRTVYFGGRYFLLHLAYAQIIKKSRKINLVQWEFN
jgi:hypothetical protein